MLKFYVKTSEAVRRLLSDKDGVVSLEYVIEGLVSAPSSFLFFRVQQFQYWVPDLRLGPDACGYFNIECRQVAAVQMAR